MLAWTRPHSHKAANFSVSSNDSVPQLISKTLVSLIRCPGTRKILTCEVPWACTIETLYSSDWLVLVWTAQRVPLNIVGTNRDPNK